MRGRSVRRLRSKRAAATALVVGMLVLPALPAWATPDPVDDWTTVTGTTALFLTADSMDPPPGWLPPPGPPLSPFGGDSVLPQDDLAPVMIDSVLDILVSTSSTGVFMDPNFPGPILRLDPVPGEGFDLQPWPGSLGESILLPPTAPGPDQAPGTLEELLTLIGFSSSPADIVGGPPLPVSDDIILVPTGYPEQTPLDGPVLIRGARTTGPLPVDDCNGNILELGTVDNVGIPWAGPAPNDLFAGGSHAIVTRCVNGVWQPAVSLVNNGDRFEPEQTAHTISVISPHGWLQFTPYDQVAGTTGTRIFAFTTPENNPYQPDTVGFTAWPQFPDLSPPEDRPWIAQNPYPSFFEPMPVGQWPAPIDFSSGSCPPEDWSHEFELYAFETEDPSVFGGYLLQLGSGQSAVGDLTVGESGIGGSLTGSGSGYSETYDFSTGQYTHLNSAECTWAFAPAAPTMTAMTRELTAFGQPPPPPVSGTDDGSSGNDGSASGDGSSTGGGSSTDETPQDASTPEATPGQTEEAAPVSSSSGDTPLWPFPFFVFGLGLLTAGGVVTVRNRRKEPATAPPGTLGGYYGVTEDDGLTLEDLEQYNTQDLGTYTEPRVPPPVIITGPDDAWDALILQEHALQTKIERDFEQLTTALTTGYSAYLKAVDDYRTSLAPVTSATIDMDRALVVGQQDLATAKTADFLWAVLTISKSIGTIGFKAYKWLKTPKAVSGASSLARAADDVGIDMGQWMSRFDDAAVGGSELLLEVAKRRGWKMMPTWSEWTLKRILFNVRSAQAGRVAHIPYDDITKLREWAGRPGFWDDLAVAANHVDDADGLVDDIALAFTKEDIDFLKAIAGADDLAHVLDDVPDALKAPGAFSGPVRMPITQFLPDHEAYAYLWRQRNAPTLAPGYAGPPAFDSSAGTFLDAASGVRGSGASARPFGGVVPEADTFIDASRRFDPNADTLLDLPGTGFHPAPPVGFNPNADTVTDFLPPTGFHPGPPVGFNPHGDTLIDGWRRGWNGIPPTNWDRAPTWVDTPIPPTNWQNAPTVVDMPIPPTNWQNAPTVIDMPIPATNWQNAPTLIDMPIPPTNWQRADTVVSFRFPSQLEDVTVDFFSTQPTLLTHGCGSVDEAAQVAGALRSGPGGTVVLTGSGCTEVAQRIDPLSRFTTSTLPDGSCAYGADAITVGASPGAVIAVHGPDAAAAALRGANPGGVPFLDPTAVGRQNPAALDAIVGEGLLNRAASYVGLTSSGFTVAAGPGETPADLTVGSLQDPGFGLCGYQTPYGVESNVVMSECEAWSTPDQPLESLFSDCGLDPDLWLGSHTDDPFAGMDTLMGELGQRKGWHPIEEQHRGFLDKLIEDARKWAVTGEGPIDPASLGRLQAWSAQPGFYPWLVGSVAPVDEGYLILYNLDDVNLLQTLSLSGGNLDAFRQRLGPTRVSAYRSVLAGGAKGSAAGATPTRRRVDPQRAHFEQVIRSYLNATHTSQIGLDQFLRSFGAVNELEHDFKFWFFGTRTVEKGETATFLNAWWSFFSAPIETYTSWYWTDEAHDMFIGLLDTQRDNLAGMTVAANAAVRSLQGILDALGVLDDPNSGLGSNTRAGLQAVLDDMKQTFEGAPGPWQDAHREPYLEKQGHIRTKLANLQSALGPLSALQEQLPKLISWLNALRLDENGEVRAGYQLISPEVAARLGSVALALQGLANPALMLDAATQAAARGEAPTSPRPVLTWEEIEAQATEQSEAMGEYGASADSTYEPMDLGDLDMTSGDGD